MKSVFRFFSFVFLAVAILAGALDSIRSVSTSTVSIVSLAAAWFDIFPALLAMAEAAVTHYIHPEAWRWVAMCLSGLPAFAVLLGLSLLCWMIGYRKPKRQIGHRFVA
jgi:DMSO reductase anchor subunit